MYWCCASVRTAMASSRAHMRRCTACMILYVGLILGWVRYEYIKLTVLEIYVAFVLESTTLKQPYLSRAVLT